MAQNSPKNIMWSFLKQDRYSNIEIRKLNNHCEIIIS